MNLGRGRDVKGVKTAFDLTKLDHGPHSCLRFWSVGTAGRFKSQPSPHGFWAHPDVPPAWNPRRGHLQFRGDQDAMVRAPAPSLLRNAVFQHSHPRTKEAPNDRLNHACPKVEAFKARRAVEGLHEGGLVEG